MALPASLIRQMQNAITTGKLTMSITLQAKSGATFGTPVPVTAVLKDDTITQELSDRQHERIQVRRVVFELMQSGVVVSLGDQLTYSAVNFIIEAISGLDVPVITATIKTTLGAQGKGGGLRAPGGGL